MSLKDHSRVAEDGTARVGGGKPLPQPGYQPIRFEDGIRMEVTPNNDKWRRISIPVTICEGPDEGKDFLVQLTLTSGGEAESFADTAQTEIVTYLDVLALLEKFEESLKQDGVDIGEDLFREPDQSGNYTVFNYEKADAVCRKLKGFLPGKIIDTIIDLREEKGSFGKFYRPRIVQCAPYGSGKFNKSAGKSIVRNSSNRQSATNESDFKDWDEG